MPGTFAHVNTENFDQLTMAVSAGRRTQMYHEESALVILRVHVRGQRHLNVHLQVHRKDQTAVHRVPDGDRGRAQPDQLVVGAPQPRHLLRHARELPDAGQRFQVRRQTVLAQSRPVVTLRQLLVPTQHKVARAGQRHKQNVGNFTPHAVQLEGLHPKHHPGTVFLVGLVAVLSLIVVGQIVAVDVHRS
uniref:(northern house mosquito) hypothetical protein n=1 Tax=Culex pipiens TaxID=7175 RepID=A0A8D8AGY6_CULPI